ncbi:hypothetical protein DBV15_12957, partial [Temnothorax longispinosus]
MISTETPDDCIGRTIIRCKSTPEPGARIPERPKSLTRRPSRGVGNENSALTRKPRVSNKTRSQDYKRPPNWHARQSVEEQLAV